MEMKIEWAPDTQLFDDPPVATKVDGFWKGCTPAPVVRLEAVDAVIGEAVWAMEWVRDSAYRFFPLQLDPTFGVTLDPFDLAQHLKGKQRRLGLDDQVVEPGLVRQILRFGF